eukprot:SAG22_NODE_1108_length_5550_cov_4.655109_1_plen_22_part_10
MVRDLRPVSSAASDVLPPDLTV